MAWLGNLLGFGGSSRTQNVRGSDTRTPSDSTSGGGTHVHTTPTNAPSGTLGARTSDISTLSPPPAQRRSAKNSGSEPGPEGPAGAGVCSGSLWGGSRCLRVAAAVALFVSLGLFAFTLAYHYGAFPFETFIGSIGPSVFISASGALVFLSTLVLGASYCCNERRTV